MDFFGFLCSVLKEFERVPSHLTEELHLFSLDDLVKIKRGQLLPLLKEILKSSTSHVDGCEVRKSWYSWVLGVRNSPLDSPRYFFFAWIKPS